MSGIDEVLERLVTDPQFRELLQRDPAAALSGYVLYDEDLEVLAATLDDAGGGERSVEQRTSKSAFLYALTGLIDESGGGLADQLGSDDGPAADASRFGSPTDMKDLPDPEDEVYAGAGKVGATDMRDLPDPQDEVYDGQAGGTAPSDLATPGEPEEAPFVKLLSVDGETTDAPAPPDGDSVDSEREAVAPDPVPAEDAEGPAGLRSDGELVQASDAREVPEAEPGGTAEEPITKFPDIKGEVQQHDSVVLTEQVTLTIEAPEPYSSADPAEPTDLVAPDESEELILPAVQKVREAADLEDAADVQIKNAPGSEPPQETDLESPAGGPESNKEDIARFEVEVGGDLAEGTPDGDEEHPETALPRSARSQSNMTPGIEGSDVSTG